MSLLPILIIGCTPVFPWIRKRLQAWAEGKPASGIIAAPEKGNDSVPPCEIVLQEDAIRSRARVCAAVNALSDIALLAVLVLSCMSVASGGYNPFIYFQF